MDLLPIEEKQEAVDTSAPVPPKDPKEKRKKAVRGLLNFAGVFVGVFLLFVVVVVMTTDIRITSIKDAANLGLAFFVLLFCSYSMYVNCADSGMRVGLVSKVYTDTQEDYNEMKSAIVKNGYQTYLPAFCRSFVENELKSARFSVLAEVGISYDIYHQCYLGRDGASIRSCVKTGEISKNQAKAIIAANKIKPVHLSPEMILRRGRGSNRREPLGRKPETKRKIDYSIKFLRTFVISALLAIIALEITQAPSWTMFASILLKLLSVVLNGFFGFKYGYENITVDTVNYTLDQMDLMKQLETFAKKEKTGSQ